MVPIRADPVDAGRCARVVEVVGLDQLQTPFEVAALDRPNKGVDHRRDRRRLTRGPRCGALVRVRATLAPIPPLLYQIPRINVHAETDTAAARW